MSDTPQGRLRRSLSALAPPHARRLAVRLQSYNSGNREVSSGQRASFVQLTPGYQDAINSTRRAVAFPLLPWRHRL